MIATGVRTLAKRWLVARHCRTFPFEHYQRRHGCLFIHIPKTAGTSILEALGKRTGGRLHLPWYVYRAADPLFFAAAWKFAFVRNPWDRVHSAWSYLMSGGNQGEDRRLTATLQAFGSFERFVIDGLQAGAWRNHPLFLSQAEFVCGLDGEPIVDFLGRYETVEQDFAAIAERLGLPPRLPVRNVTKQRAPSSEQHWTPDTINVIRSIYAQDVRQFGYQPPQT